MTSLPLSIADEWVHHGDACETAEISVRRLELAHPVLPAKRRDPRIMNCDPVTRPLAIIARKAGSAPSTRPTALAHFSVKLHRRQGVIRGLDPRISEMAGSSPAMTVEVT
jgi:hypothetical protein